MGSKLVKYCHCSTSSSATYLNHLSVFKMYTLFSVHYTYMRRWIHLSRWMKTWLKAIMSQSFPYILSSYSCSNTWVNNNIFPANISGSRSYNISYCCSKNFLSYSKAYEITYLHTGTFILGLFFLWGLTINIL